MEQLGLPVPTLWFIVGGGWSTAVGMAVWFVRLIWTGKLVPESQHLRELAQITSVAESRQAELVIWREAAMTNGSQVGQLLETQETQVRLLKALDPQEKP